MEPARAEASALPVELRADQADPRADPFVGQEVSCRLVSALLDAATATGLDVDAFTRGLPYPIEHLRDHRARVDWQTMTTLMNRLTAARSVDDILAWGRRVVDTRAMRWFAIAGRLFYDIDELYERAVDHITPYCTVLDASLAHVAPGHVRIQVTTAPGYPPMPAAHLPVSGFLSILPTMMLLPQADVELQEIGNGVIYDIHFERYRGPLARLRRWVSQPFAARRLSRELHESHLHLHQRHAELIRSEQAHRALMEEASDAILIACADLRILDSNAAARAMFGYSADELRGLPIGEILALDLDPPDPDADRELARGERLVRERILRRRGGETFPAEVSSKRLADGRVQSIFRDITLRRELEEDRKRHAERLEAAVEERTRELQHANAKLRRLQASRIRAGTLQAAEDLAASVAHSVNNPLAALLGTIELMREDAGVASPRIERIAELAGRIHSVVSQTLQLFRDGRLTTTLESPDSVVWDAVEAIRLSEPGLHVEVELEHDLPKIRVDRPLLISALVALAENGRDAMGGEGTLTLRAARVPGVRVIRFQVCDTGCGIPEAIRDRVLEPFFTTKGAGTGLGLPIANGIAQGHSGRLEVRENPGGGTCVTIDLPTTEWHDERTLESPERTPRSRE